MTSVPLPSGSVVQTLSVTKTDTYESYGTSWSSAVPGLTIAITPQYADSKILITGYITLGDNGFMAYYKLLRNGSEITEATGDAAGSRPRVAGASNYITNVTYAMDPLPINYLDSPNTTNEIVYGISIRSYTATKYARVNRCNSDRDTVGYEPRAISTLTVQEIKA